MEESPQYRVHNTITKRVSGARYVVHFHPRPIVIVKALVEELAKKREDARSRRMNSGTLQPTVTASEEVKSLRNIYMALESRWSSGVLG